MIKIGFVCDAICAVCVRLVTVANIGTNISVIVSVTSVILIDVVIVVVATVQLLISCGGRG